MSRYRAALYHLSISLIVFFVLAYLVVFVWYPDFFYSIDGGWEGMRIIIGVDLVLGPTLTLIVFKSGKPGLKFDLTLIGLFQSACLMAGVYIVYTERPLYFVYYEQHFYSVNAGTFERYGLLPPVRGELHPPLPEKVYVRLPDNPIEEADLRGILYRDSIPLWLHRSIYSPLQQKIEQIIDHGFQEDELRKRDSDGKIDAWLDDHGGNFGDYAFLPIHSRYRDAFISIDRENLSLVDILELRPPL